MTLEELRARFPDKSEEMLLKALAIINAKPLSIHEIWDSENDVSEHPQAVGPDGLTVPMRRLNRFADEHALPMPFPPREPPRRK